LISSWLRSSHRTGENRLDVVRLELLSHVAEQAGQQTTLAAALMGVTTATYRSWLQKSPMSSQ